MQFHDNRRFSGVRWRAGIEVCPVSAESVRERTVSAPALAPSEIEFTGSSSLSLALDRRWAEAAAFAHALTKLFPLLRGHVAEALLHAAAEAGAPMAAPSVSAEQHAA